MTKTLSTYLRNAGTLLLAGLVGLLLARVASAQISILSPLSDDREAFAGESYDGTVLIRNDTTEPQQVKIYQRDYRFFSDGTNQFAEPGTIPRSNADWIRLSDTRLLLRPNQTAELVYVVDVPTGDARRCGTYWSVVFAEALAPTSPEVLGEERDLGRMATQTAMRYGIQVATHMAGSACATELAFDTVEVLQTDAGERLLDVQIANTGETMLRPEMWIEIYRDTGSGARRIDGQPRRLYPGTSVSQRFDVTGVPPGEYVVLIVADGGDDALFGAQLALSL